MAGRFASLRHGQGGHEWVQAFAVRVREDPHDWWAFSKGTPADLQDLYGAGAREHHICEDGCVRNVVNHGNNGPDLARSKFVWSHLFIGGFAHGDPEAL